jgi:hypothetical protein
MDDQESSPGELKISAKTFSLESPIYLKFSKLKYDLQESVHNADYD